MAIAMKYRAAVTAIVPFFTVLLGDIPGIVKAELLWEKMQMAGDGVLFNVAFRDGGYTKPYRMKFIEDGILSIYKFKADGCVTNIKVGSERYEPVYDSSLDLTDVIRTERRSLAEHEEDSAEYFDEGTMFGKRLLFSSCDNCVSTWDAVCGEGVPCVCSLLDFESELSPAAIKSFKTMCETFGSGLCSSSGGFEACTGQCSDDGVSLEPTSAPTTETGTSYTETGTSSTATGGDGCLAIDTDVGKSESGCYLDSDAELSLDACNFSDADVKRIEECFDSIGRANIRRVFLDDNGLTSLPANFFSGLISVERIGLGRNLLTSLPGGIFSGLTSLEHIRLDENRLSSLPEDIFSGLTSLTYLILRQNLLESLPEGLFSGSTSLEYLDIIRNRLTSVPRNIFSGLTSLDYLSIYENDVESLPAGLFSDLMSLEALFLGENALTTLPKDIFSGLTVLDSLGLEGNQLTTLPPEVFSGMENLSELALGDNDITTLPDGIFLDVVKGSILTMDEGKLQCQPSFAESSSFAYNDPSSSGTCDCPVDFPDICGSGVACSSGGQGFVCG